MVLFVAHVSQDLTLSEEVETVQHVLEVQVSAVTPQLELLLLDGKFIFLQFSLLDD